MKAHTDALVRVVKGRPTDEELAAVTAVLLARAATITALPPTTGAPLAIAGWQRPLYCSALSWQEGRRQVSRAEH